MSERQFKKLRKELRKEYGAVPKLYKYAYRQAKKGMK